MQSPASHDMLCYSRVVVAACPALSNTTCIHKCIHGDLYMGVLVKHLTRPKDQYLQNLTRPGLKDISADLISFSSFKEIVS